MNREYTISVFTEDHIGLMNRVSVAFSRRHMNIDSIAVSESEVNGIHRYTLVVKESEEKVRKLVAQLEKQVEVFKAFYHASEDIVHQEIALYKIPTSALASGGEAERIIREHHARLLSMETDFTVIEKTGHKHETEELLRKLQPYGVLEFVRSGRVAITKPMKELKEYLQEMGIKTIN